MKKLLIVSATSRNNLILAESIEKICDNLNVDTELINIEEYSIPLYTPIEQDKSIPEAMRLISEKFICSISCFSHSSFCSSLFYSCT